MIFFMNKRYKLGYTYLLLISLYTRTEHMISLGAVCSTVAAFKAFDLRKEAYPFDWIISRFSPLKETLNDDFKDFLNLAFLGMRDDYRAIVNKHGLQFVHDFPTIEMEYTPAAIENADEIGEQKLAHNYLSFLPEVTRKYERRIARFREACTSNSKVYFFRHFGIDSKEEAQIICNIIKQQYPSLDFLLIIIGNNSSFDIPWNLPNIKNYFLNDSKVWNDVAEWQRIFSDLSLIQATKRSYKEKESIYLENLCKNCDYCTLKTKQMKK